MQHLIANFAGGIKSSAYIMKQKQGYVFLFLLLLISVPSFTQLYKVSGTVRDNRNEPLPLANVEVKELRKGAVTKDDGSYQFFLERGKYDLVVSMIGYKTKIITVFITNTSATITAIDTITYFFIGDIKSKWSI